MVNSQGNRWGVMERDSQSSVWIWESGDPVERADLLPDAGINDFDWAHAHHHITHVGVRPIFYHIDGQNSISLKLNQIKESVENRF